MRVLPDRHHARKSPPLNKSKCKDEIGVGSSTMMPRVQFHTLVLIEIHVEMSSRPANFTFSSCIIGSRHAHCYKPVTDRPHLFT
jgi:hypothetical protein